MMLVLSRKIGNRIVIAENIEITVLQVRGTKVLLGVNAPRHVSIMRSDARKQCGEIDPVPQRGSPGAGDGHVAVELSP
jgi:carbon storage regulator